MFFYPQRGSWLSNIDTRGSVHVRLYIYIYLFIHSFIFLFFHLFIYSFIYLFIYLFICLFKLNLFIHLFFIDLLRSWGTKREEARTGKGMFNAAVFGFPSRIEPSFRRGGPLRWIAQDCFRQGARLRFRTCFFSFLTLGTLWWNIAFLERRNRTTEMPLFTDGLCMCIGMRCGVWDIVNSTYAR